MPLCGFLASGEVECRGNDLLVQFKSLADPEPLGIASAFASALPSHRIEPMKLEASFNPTAVRIEYNGTIEMPNGSAAIGDANGLLRIFIEHVTISDACEECHALGMHTLPAQDGETFSRTEVGSLVRRAKPYHSFDGDRDTGRQLADMMYRFVRQHPRYRRATSIVAAPPSNMQKRYDLPALMAEHLTQALGTSLVTAQQTRIVKPQKDVEGVEELSENRRDSVRIADDLRGEAVIVLDDIYRSGQTLSATASACRAAGAAEVLGLTASKTMKYAQGLPV